MGALYLVGVGFYVTRFPESKYPGKFDGHVCLIYIFS